MAAKKKNKKKKDKQLKEKNPINSTSALARVNNPFLFAAAVVITAFIVRLVIFAGNTLFFTDECFHSLLSQRMAKLHYSLFTPELYSGITINIPPFLHFLGGIDVLLFGVSGLPYLNIFLLALLMASGLYFVGRYFSPLAAGTAFMAIVTSNLVAHFALAFYQEMLTMVVLTALLLFIYLAYTRVEWKYAILAGIFLGLLFLTKQTGRVMPLCLVISTGYLALKKDWPTVKRFLVGGGVAILVILPHLIATAIDTGSLFHPYFSTVEADPWFSGLQSQRWYTDPASLLSGIYDRYEFICSALSILGIAYLFYMAFGKERKKGYGLILFILLVHLGIFSLIGRGEPRHFLQFLPVLCFMGVCGIFTFFEKTNLQPLKYAIYIIVGIVALITVVNLVNYRERLNCNPIFMDSYKYLAENTSEDAKILSVWTYSTHYYTGRHATWPHGTVPEGPIDLYKEKNPARFREICKQRKLEYILVDYAKLGQEPNSTNYPLYFVQCLETLRKSGQAEVFYPRRGSAIVDNPGFRAPAGTPPGQVKVRNPETGKPAVCIRYNIPQYNLVGCFPRITVYKINIK